MNTIFAKKLNRNSLRTILWLCVIFNALAFFVTISSYPPVWYTNDDYRMMTIVAGAYTGTPCADIVFMRYPVGLFLSFLYTLTNEIPWYGLFTMICMFIPSCVFSYYIIKKTYVKNRTFLGILIYALVFIVFIRKYICLPQFTLTSAFMGVASAVIIYEMPDKNNLKHIIFASACALLSFSVRSKAFYMILPMIVVIVIVRIIGEKGTKIWKSFIATGMTIVVLCGIVFAVDTLAYTRNEQYEEFKRFNKARATVYDYGDLPSYNSNAEYFLENGIDEVTYRAIATRYLDLVESIDAEKLEVVGEFNESIRFGSSSFVEQIIAACEEAISYWLESGDSLVKYGSLTVLITCFASVFMAIKKKKKNYIFPLSVAGFVLESIALAYAGRIVVRVLDALLLALGVIGAFAIVDLISDRNQPYREVLKNIFKDKSKAFLSIITMIALVVMSCFFAVSINEELKMKYESVAVTQNSRLNALKDYAKTQPDVFFFYESTNFISSTDYAFRTYEDGEIQNHDSMGSWNVAAPSYYERNARFGFTTSGDGLTSDIAQVRFVTTGTPKMGITMALKDIYNKKLVLVDTIDGDGYILSVYAVVDDD